MTPLRILVGLGVHSAKGGVTETITGFVLMLVATLKKHLPTLSDQVVHARANLLVEMRQGQEPFIQAHHAGVQSRKVILEVMSPQERFQHVVIRQKTGARAVRVPECRNPFLASERVPSFGAHHHDLLEAIEREFVPDDTSAVDTSMVRAIHLQLVDLVPEMIPGLRIHL